MSNVISFRHLLHQIPEIAFKEYKTSETIRNFLRTEGVFSDRDFFPTSVSGVLDSGSSGPVILLRADIDALPLSDLGHKEWCSKHEGMSHSCGHDGHSAILAGTLIWLNKNKSEWNGKVRYLFQPAEENIGGGKELIKEGFLDSGPWPDRVYALHGWPGLEEGIISAKPGAQMAAADHFKLTLTGKGGHGAMPHMCKDPIISAARLVEAMQSVISRKTSPLKAAVLTIGSISAGTTGNIIPESAAMEGTVRYFDTELKDFFPLQIEKAIKGICLMDDLQYELDYRAEYIPLINNSRAVESGRKAAEKAGLKFTVPEEPSMAAEDFSFFTKEIKGAFFWLGLGKDCPSLHSPDFDFNDNVIEKGISFFRSLISSGKQNSST